MEAINVDYISEKIKPIYIHDGKSYL